MAEERFETRTILAVFPPGEDREFLGSLFEKSDWRLRFDRAFLQSVKEASVWRLRFADSLEEVRAALRSSAISVVLSDAELSDGCCWKDLLREIGARSDPPPLIVADRLADEVLWVEVLNLGGFDLLMKPLTAREVLHVVSSACRFHENEARLALARDSAGFVESDASKRPKTRAAQAAS
jgi:DNA-binding response OmpR family regulator